MIDWRKQLVGLDYQVIAEANDGGYSFIVYDRSFGDIDVAGNRCITTIRSWSFGSHTLLAAGIIEVSKTLVTDDDGTNVMRTTE